MDPYYYIILFSAVVIFSYIFNSISSKTNLPSVILLIGIGVCIQILCTVFKVDNIEYMKQLEILGIIGVILIVLEAVLDLKIRKDKIGLIIKTILSSIIGLVGCTYIISFIFRFFLDLDINNSILYALPLSVLSSAIVIPSVSNLNEYNKEFLIYESIFSDIIGIIVFYAFLKAMPVNNIDVIDSVNHVNGHDNHSGFSLFSEIKSIIITIVFSLIISFSIIFIFKKIKAETKLFFLLSVLFLLYSVGKLFHLSSLIIILIFGLIISYQNTKNELDDEDNNSDDSDHKWFYLKEQFRIEKSFFHDLDLITKESAFLVRTLFFVVFGFSISIGSLFNLDVIICGVIVFLSVFLFRYLKILLINGKIISVLFGVAPRGLITVLLFFSIPEHFHQEDSLMEIIQGVMLFIILGTSFFMAYSLIQNSKQKKDKDVKLDIINQADEDVDLQESNFESDNNG